MDRVDEKGKIFTQRVRKHSVEVDIVTLRGRVRGFLHVAPGNRVKDQLNDSSEQFLAVTLATMVEDGRTDSGARQGDTARVDFIAINKQHVISVVPIDEKRAGSGEDQYYS